MRVPLPRVRACASGSSHCAARSQRAVVTGQALRPPFPQADRAPGTERRSIAPRKDVRCPIVTNGVNQPAYASCCSVKPMRALRGFCAVGLGGDNSHALGFGDIKPSRFIRFDDAAADRVRYCYRPCRLSSVEERR